ncbi:WG repeat-containing protein [Streptomyces sp. NPDC101132]|uniref:WG repeat-containing protein n=1 Tax=Streptomyces sp. NPDC101132 TaxID=3366110 RepID=UPI003821DE17
MTPSPPHAVPVIGAGGFGQRFALVGADGRLIREPVFSAVGRFVDDGRGGLTAPAAGLDGTWGYLGGDGHWRVRPAFEKATAFDSAGRSRFRADGLWGYADASGAVVIPARFAGAGPFGHGPAAVRTEGGCGYVDGTGRLVVGGTYRDAGPFAPNGLAAVVTAEDRRGYVDREGRLVVAVAFDEARAFNAAGTAPVRVGELWGLLDEAGEWVVEPSFRHLAGFDENGLAYALGEPAGGSSAGFVDHRGETVISHPGEQDDVLRHGLLRVGYGSTRGFLDARGRQAIEAVYAWADGFDDGGAAVARPEECGTWGVLRADGSYTPSGHPEPLTDEDGWVVGFDGGHGLAPFRTAEGHVAHVGRHGREVCRVAPDAPDGSAVVLRDARGTAVWRGTADPGTFLPEPPFLTADPERHLCAGLTLHTDPEPLVRELAEQPPRPFYPRSEIFGPGDDPYDLEELDEYDLDHASNGALRVLATTWLAAELEAEYPFLEDHVQEGFGRIHDAFEAGLRAAYGDPLPGVHPCLRGGDGNTSLAWEVAGRHLVLELYFQIGDGDRECQIWLALVDPS